MLRDLPQRASPKELTAICLAFLFVVQKAIALRADDLAAKPDADNPTRLAALDAFVETLIREAKNAPLGGLSEAEELNAKSTVIDIIRTVSSGPMARLQHEHSKPMS